MRKAQEEIYSAASNDAVVIRCRAGNDDMVFVTGLLFPRIKSALFEAFGASTRLQMNQHISNLLLMRFGHAIAEWMFASESSRMDGDRRFQKPPG